MNFFILHVKSFQVGMAFVAGVAFVVILIPVNRCLANRIGVLSEKMMEAKDRRISLVRELLRGILYIKMHLWTDMFHVSYLITQSIHIFIAFMYSYTYFKMLKFFSYPRV